MKSVAGQSQGSVLTRVSVGLGEGFRTVAVKKNVTAWLVEPVQVSNTE